MKLIINKTKNYYKKEMKKNIYVAPVVELLEARVEKGFAGSGSSQDIPNVGLSVYYNQAGTGNGTGNPNLTDNDNNWNI